MMTDPSSTPLARRIMLQGTSLQESFDRVTRLAARTLAAPCAQLDIVLGMDVSVRSVAAPEPLATALRRGRARDTYSPLVVRNAKVLAVSNMMAHHVLAEHPATRTYHIGGYLAVPLSVKGEIVGALAVFDTAPRAWVAADEAALRDLGAFVESAMAEWDRTTTQSSGSVVESFRTVGSLLDDGIIVTDKEGRIVYANPSIEALSGYRPEEMLGAQLWQLLAPDVIDEERNAWSLIDENPRLVRFITSTGVPWWADVRVTELRDDIGSTTGMIAHFKDATEHQRLQDQFTLSQRRESVGQLAIGLTHDFNNMLTIVLGSAQLAMMELEPTTQLYSDLDEIYRAASRAARLTRQILAFARKLPTAPQLVNINELIIDVSKLFRWAIRDNIELVALPYTDDALVKASPGQIEQALLNLVLRGQEMMPSGGNLHVEIHSSAVDGARARKVGVVPGEYVAISVHAASKENMLGGEQPPLNETAVRSSDIDPQDLRLAASLVIIEQHNGYLEYAVLDGQSMSATMYLPLSQERLEADSNELSVEALPRGKETILVVEDEASMRGLAGRFLRTLGYTVLEAANGDAALRLVYSLPHRSIQMVVADMVMPQMDGEELVEHLRARQPGINVLFMSGYVDLEDGNHKPFGSNISYLQKPFMLNVLAYRVRQMLDAAA